MITNSEPIRKRPPAAAILHTAYLCLVVSSRKYLLMGDMKIDLIAAVTSGAISASLSKRAQPGTQKIRQFSLDLLLVACGFREMLGNADDKATQGIDLLLMDSTQNFHHVIFVSTYDQSQTFAINVPALVTAIQDEWTTFVPLRSQLGLEGIGYNFTMPLFVEIAVAKIMALGDSDLPAHCTLDDLDAGSLVALAGLLLEYPVSYHPTPLNASLPQIEGDEDDFGPLLSGIEVHVFRCTVDVISPLHDSRRHEFMKFSCPTSVAQALEARCGQTFANRIVARWKDRLPRITASGTITVEIQTATFDRLAL
ncbi:hypothetical protein FRB97_000791 [Tulasnella sp. 331]|nr:hypothetical protein FRB97_000791 [Tulasnella sp. 331]